MSADRLARQIQFIVEVDKLKRVLRQTMLIDRSRQENAAEHSWHIALMALLLAEYATEPVDPLRVVKMLLIHDIIEIDAGDTFLYDTAANEDKAERERRAADRLFSLLPPDQAAEVRALWEEFEARETPDARFAGALDRLQPLVVNYHAGGPSWQKHSITADQVLQRVVTQIAPGSSTLEAYARGLVSAAVVKGYLKP